MTAKGTRASAQAEGKNLVTNIYPESQTILIREGRRAALLALRAKVVAQAITKNKERELYRKMKSSRNFDITEGEIVALQWTMDELDRLLKDASEENKL